MQERSPTKYSMSSVLSALIGSWWWIAALAYALLGGGAGLAASLAAYREWLGPFRDIFFFVALILIARSHYLYWGGLRKGAKWATTLALWVSTALTLAMTAVFYVYENPAFFWYPSGWSKQEGWKVAMKFLPKGEKCFKTGLWGSIVAAICCFTPVLVVGLGLIGLAAFTPYLDYVLFPVLAFFLILMLYGWSKRHKGIQ